MKRTAFNILLICTLLFIPSCGVWDNFTTYFNLYYNTEEAFTQAEEAINLQPRSIFSTQDIPIPGSANQLLNRVIEKSSKILQFHSSTSYIDDALMMLGKSFYYQKNYLKAVRKFQELTASQKNSSLYLEAELWTAKTMMKMRDFDNALATLDSVKIRAIEDDDDKILSQAYIEETIYYVARENYTEAIKTAEEVFKVAPDDEIKAETAYEIGNFYIKLEDPEKALTYYQMVEDYSPDYLVLVNALTERGRTLRTLGQNERALDIFEGMRLEDKFRDNFDIIDYEIGMTYLAMDRIPEAVENLVFVDTSYTTSLYSGLARYNLGRLYENELPNFDSAAVYYQKATASQLPAEKVREVHSRNQVFIKYGQISKRISDAGRQLTYIDNPDLFVKDSTVYYDSIKAQTAADSLQTAGDEQGGLGRNTRQVQQQPLQNQLVKGPPVRPSVPRDTVLQNLLRSKFDLANLFFAEMHKPDSAAKYYTNILSDTGASQYHSRSLYALGNFYLSSGDSAKSDSIFNYIYDTYKQDRVVNAAAVQLKKPLINLSFDPAEEIYADAERLWINKSYEDALDQYQKVYKEFPQSSFAPKALLATGWILENDLKRPDSAAVVYDSISVRYGGTLYAQKITPKLIAYKQEQMKRQREIEDSIRVANQKSDTLKVNDSMIVTPDSLSEADKIRLEMEKAQQDNTEVELKPEENIEDQEIKTDTTQPQNNQSPERRNPRRRR